MNVSMNKVMIQEGVLAENMQFFSQKFLKGAQNWQFWPVSYE